MSTARSTQEHRLHPMRAVCMAPEDAPRKMLEGAAMVSLGWGGGGKQVAEYGPGNVRGMAVRRHI